jgi:uncharacterized protein
MTSAIPQTGPSQAPPPGGPADPSMEDILASIRRILSEDESEQAAGAPAEAQAGSGSGVLALDPSMLVEEPAPAPVPVPVPMAPPRLEPPLPGMQAPRAAEPPPPAPPPPARAPDVSLMAPETAAAAASSVGSLLRTLVSERQQVAVHRGGPTLEDMVREELRPLLKQWLDTNLPAMVERQVRAEIERVVGRGLA